MGISESAPSFFSRLRCKSAGGSSRPNSLSSLRHHNDRPGERPPQEARIIVHMAHSPTRIVKLAATSSSPDDGYNIYVC